MSDEQTLADETLAIIEKAVSKSKKLINEIDNQLFEDNASFDHKQQLLQWRIALIAVIKKGETDTAEIQRMRNEH